MTTKDTTKPIDGPSTDAVRPTKKQRELLVFIDAFIKEHGYSPSYREIMNGCRYTSVATVALHVTSLIQRGHIRKRDRSARSLELTHPVKPEENEVLDSEVKAKAKSAADGKEQAWLKRKADELFQLAEADAELDAAVVADLQTVLRFLEVLGMAELAQGYETRITTLRERLTAAGTDSV